jgi:23S rRNA (adenine2030-N6)-methyltransferase
MNYRHIFHAGNFADLFKHAVLIELLGAMTRGPALTVIDTHAGAGLYDLSAEAARKTGEGAAGVARLMAETAPSVFDGLKTAVRRANAGDAVRHYPGSPTLIAAALRPGDRYIACELRPDDHAALRAMLPREPRARALKEDGWLAAARLAPRAPAALLVLIDPPFEAGDDYRRAAETVQAILTRNAGAAVAIWTPIKDFATFDAFVGDLEDAAPSRPILVAQSRLRPLTDPMKLNGCAMIVINPPAALAGRAGEAAAWVAATLGDPGGEGRAEVFGG